MKYILLILAAVGLTACSTGVVKNESGEEISVKGNSVADGACYEWTVVFGFIGDTEVAIQTTGDEPTQVGDKEAYDVGYYVVKSTAQDAAAVEKVDEAPKCEPAEGDDPEAALAEAKQAAVEAAEAAVAAAEAAVQKATDEQTQTNSSTTAGPPEKLAAEQKKEKAEAAKAKADAAKAEAEAADTVEAANAAKAKADEAKAEAEAI